jgi:predicted amidophosphoribosyltransferase
VTVGASCHSVAVAGRGCWVCSGCGQSRAARPALGDTAAYRPPVCRNSWCAAPDRPLGAVFSVGNYEGALRRAIVAYKYGADLRWARLFGHLIHRFLVSHANWFDEYGVICPVPSFVGAGARRSWGHVELFCAEVGWRAGAEWPVEQLVVKGVETETMSAKPHPVRRRIAKDVLPAAFVAPCIDDVKGRRVVIVDDVCASGGTLLAVAGALRKAGAAEVAGLVLARASWHSVPG